MPRILALALLLVLPAVARAQAPHAWLFGMWSGGLFPPPPGLGSAPACLTQPVVIFTRDVVLRATLTDTAYIQRVIATARTAKNTTSFQFAPSEGAAAVGLLGGAAAPAQGFGCTGPNTLTVQRVTDNEISFPGCGDFPYPLVRCTAR